MIKSYRTLVVESIEKHMKSVDDMIEAHDRLVAAMQLQRVQLLEQQAEIRLKLDELTRDAP